MDAGLIGNPTIFRLYAGQRGVAGRFKAGRYEIDAPATPKQILDTLVKGAADELVTVVVPPGKNLLEVAEILAAAGIAGKAELAAEGERSRVRRGAGPARQHARGLSVPRHLPPAPAQHAGARADPAGAPAPPGLGRAARRAREGGAGAEEDAGLRGPQHRRARVDRRERDGPSRGAPAHRAGVHQPPADADVRAQAAADRPDHHLRLHGRDAEVRRLPEVGRPHPPHPPRRSGQPVQHVHPRRAAARADLEPGPRGAGSGARARQDAVPLLRRQERRDAPVLAHGRRAQRRGREVPARRQGACRSERGAAPSSPKTWARSSTRPPAWARCCAGASSGGRSSR